LKILHYLPGLPPVRGGGLVKYALDLAEGETEAGNEVLLLIPGKFKIWNKKTEIVKRKWKGLLCYEILNALPLSEGHKVKQVEYLCQEGEGNVYREFLKDLRPDIIHIHTFMGLHLAFLETAKQLKITIVYTSHDYYGLCPKITHVIRENICMEENWTKCGLCMEGQISERKMYWRQSDLYRILKGNIVVQWLEYSPIILPVKLFIKKMIRKQKQETFLINQENGEIEYEKLRQYYLKMYQCVTKFHFNSVQAQNVYMNFLKDVKGKVIYISNKNITDRRKKREYTGSLRIGYIGPSQYFKGFPMLKNVLDELYKEGLQDFVCQVYFNPQDMKTEYLKSNRPYKSCEIEQVYENIDILVLPSVWQETFGMVILEALSFGVPVIVSQNVGAKEILGEGMGIIIKGREDLKSEIRKIYYDRDILRKMNAAICEGKVELSFAKHIADMLEFYMW